MDEDWMIGNAKCNLLYGNLTEPGYCSPIWDRYLCWPSTPPGQIVTIRCPQSKGIDTSQSAYRTCGFDGIWLGKDGIGTTPEDFKKLSNNVTMTTTSTVLATNPASVTTYFGWTNYSQCFSPGIRELLKILNSQSEYDTKRKLLAAEGTRVLEMIGLSVSMISLMISLLIFYRFRNLRNNRTRIHKNLFIAMTIQVLVRLIVYIDQYVSRSASSLTIKPYAVTSNSTRIDGWGIEDTEYVCESFYILLEYARTSMFLWMFVEGLYLHNMISVAVFQERLSPWFFHSIGWGCPVVLTCIWAGVTFSKFHGITCWWGYNLTPYFWILEGPRLTVIIINLMFLLNIIRVLVTKLRESNSSEAQQVRKAVRAAVVLLPLLGITNSIQMIVSPVDKDAVQFAIWSYFTSFLTSFQGFFCALIYCFLNGEVQLSIRRWIKARKHRRDRHVSRHVSSINLDFRTRNHFREPFNNFRIGKLTRTSNDNVLTPMQQLQQPWNGTLTVPNCEQNTKPADPVQEYWNEIDLSSHNHVDIEHIEIPLDYCVMQKSIARTHECGTPP